MTKIYHAHLWGSREDKYRYLLEHDITTVEWTELTPDSPAYLFIPQNIGCKAEYEKGFRITEILNINSPGIMTARDSLTIHFSHDDVWKTVNNFLSVSPSEAMQIYELDDDTRDWRVELAQKDLSASGLSETKIKPMLYRPFDIRYTYYTSTWKGFHSLPRGNVMSHMLTGENLGLITVRQVPEGIFNHVLATNCLVDNRITSSNKGYGQLFPLYTYPNTANEQGSLFVERTQNLVPEFLSTIQEKLGYIPTPEAIFYYIYAIFHSPTYRDRYAEFLKSDFPRVPLTSNDQLFKNLSAKGEMLVDLHLMKSRKLNKLITKMSGDGDNAVTEVTYKSTEQRVYINRDRYFEGIAPDVWNFKIGGYQVLDKWLKDRKKAKRTLSFYDVLHYQKVVVALKETMKLMVEIEQLIPIFPIV